MTDDTDSVNRTSAPILDTLLRAGLCTQRLFANMDNLSQIERDETLDAISLGAIPLPQLTWEWAGTHGHIPLLNNEKEYPLDLTAFYDDLLSLTATFSIQVSSAYSEDHHDEIGIMPPFPGQRGKLANRTNWITITPAPTLTPEEIEELNTIADSFDGHADSDNPENDDQGADDAVRTEDNPGIPDLFAPALRLGTTRAGETWVRIQPEQLTDLRTAPYDLIALLATVSEAHMQQRRDTVKAQAARYEHDAAELGKLLTNMSAWETMSRRLLDHLNTLTSAQRDEKAPDALHILTTFEDPPLAKATEQRARKLRQLTKELDDLTEQPDGATLHDIQRWHDRTTTYIRTTISTKAAVEFEALLRTPTTDGEAKAMHDALRALQRDLTKHPEHYQPTTPVPADWKTMLFGWFWTLRRPWKITIAIIITIAALLVAGWKLLPEEVKVHLLTSTTAPTRRAP